MCAVSAQIGEVLRWFLGGFFGSTSAAQQACIPPALICPGSSKPDALSINTNIEPSIDTPHIRILIVHICYLVRSRIYGIKRLSRTAFCWRKKTNYAKQKKNTRLRAEPQVGFDAFTSETP
jgi:hypothetical protein